MTEEFETLFRAYVGDLEKALEDANARHQTLAMSEKYNHLGFNYDTVWPAEVGGDPAVLRVIRKYFVKCSILIERQLAAEDDEPVEAGEFGKESEEEAINPATATDFLFLTLEERDEEMSYEIRLARFMPIGFEDASTIATEAGINGA